jgi:hypothetical protein
MTPDQLARNRAEILRVVATGNFDFATARMMLWAMDICATGLRSEYNLRLRQACIHADKPNRIYQVPATPLVDRSCTLNPAQVLENTSRATGEVLKH